MRKFTSGNRSRVVSAGVTTGVVVAALLVSPQAAFAAPYTSVVPAVGPPNGTLTVNNVGLFTSTTLAGYFTTAGTCPATFTSAAPAIAATVARVSDDRATITVPATLTLGANNAPRDYKFCIYTNNSNTGALLADGGTYTVISTAMLTPPTGPSGGGNTVTAMANTPIFATVPQVRFSASACPATYGSPGALAASNVMKVGTTNNQVSLNVPLGVAGSGNVPAQYNTCFYATGDGTAALIAIGAGPYNVSLPPSTLSSVIGAAGNTSPAVNLTVSSPMNFLTGYAAPAGLVRADACPALYPTTPGGQAAPVRKITNNKVSITLPASAVVVGNSPTPYNVCVYSSASDTVGKLLTNAVYTATVMPTVTRVLPNAGPALGGSPITVIGTNFPTAPGSITATLGGTALLNVTPVNDTSFTATTPMHPTGKDQALVVTTAAGSVNLASAYEYTYGITVTPNTAPNTIPAIDVDITGVGFLTLPFANGPVASTTSDAHVYLVDGVYDATTAGADDVEATSPKSNGPVTECIDVLVISDNELICSLQLSHRLNPLGTFAPAAARTLTTDGVTVLGSPIVNSATANFTAADIGGPLSGTGIPANTTVVSVTSPTRAVLSANATASANNIAFTIGGALRSAVVVAPTSPVSNVITGTFTTADIGRPIVATGIPAGTIVTGLTNTGATLSNVSNPSGNAALYAPAPVPNGAYNLTVVNDGTLNAAADLGEDYLQSTVSSGSTFTIAPF